MTEPTTEPIKMKKCSSCEQEIADTEKVCPKCSEDLEELEEELKRLEKLNKIAESRRKPVPAPVPVPGPTPTPTPKKKSGRLFGRMKG
jgi:hypothetical protein